VTSGGFVLKLRSSKVDRPLWQCGLAAASVAAVASVAIYLVARAAGVPMALTELFEDKFARMPLMNMAWAALLDGGLGSTLLAAMCQRWSDHPRTAFLVLATIGLIASFLFPIFSDASTSTKVVLSISHVVVAMIIVPAVALALPIEAARSLGRSSDASSRHI